MLKPVLLAVILFMLIGGGGALKLLAAREVSGGQFDRFVRALVWTGWLKGQTRRAVVLRRITIAWVITLVLAWFGVALFMPNM
jgi:hypothetical protein